MLPADLNELVLLATFRHKYLTFNEMKYIKLDQRN